MKAIHGKVILTHAAAEEKKGALFLPATRAPNVGTVVTVGPQSANNAPIHVGDRVVFNPAKTGKFELNGETFLFTDWEDVIAVL